MGTKGSLWGGGKKTWHQQHRPGKRQTVDSFVQQRGELHITSSQHPGCILIHSVATHHWLGMVRTSNSIIARLSGRLQVDSSLTLYALSFYNIRPKIKAQKHCCISDWIHHKVSWIFILNMCQLISRVYEKELNLINGRWILWEDFDEGRYTMSLGFS